MALTTVEISRRALIRNFQAFKQLAPNSLVAPVVKANAYGHGLIAATRVFSEAGADWLCVNTLSEAVSIRDSGIFKPIYILGYVPEDEHLEASDIPELRLVVYDEEIIRSLNASALRRHVIMPLHIKVETGNNRQGVCVDEAVRLARLIANLPGVELEGLSSHYADIEDTTDHAYAKSQLARFQDGIAMCSAVAGRPPVCNFSNSAATLLWEESYFDLIRVGISMYGMWPSRETLISSDRLGRSRPTLIPALTWKTRIVQVKDLPAGVDVGYGRTWRTSRPTRLAVLPVGYYDGYSRMLSNLGYTLIHGERAPVRGRVCMNMTMVDVTDIPQATRDSEVILLGGPPEAAISAEQMADWSHSINYEVTTRINDQIPRLIID